MKDEKKSTKKVSAKKTEGPKYNKTWEAVIKFRGTVKVNDPTLYYQ